MPYWAKFLLGLTLALVAGWISHGPLGQGEAFLANIDSQLQAELAKPGARVQGVSGQAQRDPLLERKIVYSGPTDCFQRTGQFRGQTRSSLPGLDDRALAIPGVARVEWTNEAVDGPCP